MKILYETLNFDTFDNKAIEVDTMLETNLLHHIYHVFPLKRSFFLFLFQIQNKNVE